MEPRVADRAVSPLRPSVRNEVFVGERRFRRRQLATELDPRHLRDQSIELRRFHVGARPLDQRANFFARPRESFAALRIRSALNHGALM